MCDEYCKYLFNMYGYDFVSRNLFAHSIKASETPHLVYTIKQSI